MNSQYFTPLKTPFSVRVDIFVYMSFMFYSNYITHLTLTNYYQLGNIFCLYLTILHESILRTSFFWKMHTHDNTLYLTEKCLQSFKYLFISMMNFSVFWRHYKALEGIKVLERKAFRDFMIINASYVLLQYSR